MERRRKTIKNHGTVVSVQMRDESDDGGDVSEGGRLGSSWDGRSASVTCIIYTQKRLPETKTNF